MRYQKLTKLPSSLMKNSYEKILLAVGALIAIVLTVFAFLKLGSVEEDFASASENPRKSPPILGEVVISEAASMLASPATLEPIKVGDNRIVDSFTGIDLFVRKGEEAPIDLLASEEKPVHPPIPNLWWIQNKIDPGFGDSPQRDHDEDGFSNLEEFQAKTDPADKSSFPSLFAKVTVVEVLAEQWYLRFSERGGDELSFRIEGIQNGQKVENRMRGADVASPGDVFFAEGAYAQRFKYLERVEKEVRPGLNRQVARIQDMQPGKEAVVYEFPSGSHRTLVTDYSALLYLDTPEHEDTKFLLASGASFSLPYDPDSNEKPYTLKEIRDNGKTVVLIWNDNGEEKERILPVAN